MGVFRFGISLEKALIERFDRLIKKKGYANRSEAIRDLIRDSLVTEEWESLSDETVGIITLVYSHDTRELTDNLTDFQHLYHNAIISAMHIHLDEHNCLEAIVVKGKAKEIKTIADRLIGTKGVKHGKLTSDNYRKTFEVIFFTQKWHDYYNSSTISKKIERSPMSKLVLSCVLSITMVLSFCSASFASHPLITDDAGTQGKGKFQLEVNGGYGQDEDEGVTTKTTQILTMLTYGLSDPVDIIIGLPYEHTRVEDSGTVTRQDGISDMSLEVKWRFYQKDGLSFALKPGITFPTGDEEKGLGSGRVTYHLFFIGTKEIKPWAFHLNLGYIRNENKLDENKDLWHVSFASTVEVIKAPQVRR